MMDTNKDIQQKQHPFIQYLLGLSQREQRGELAILRRGLSQPPTQDVAMYPIVARFVPHECNGKQKEKVYYLVAALYALHPLNTNQGNFGDHMRKAAGESNREATERRFVVLLNAHLDDLPDYLRQSVSYLKSKDIPVNWDTLFSNLLHWGHPDKYIQRRWANSFWGTPASDNQNNQSSIQ